MCIRDRRDGVIADFEIAEGMIRAFIKRVRGGGPMASRRVIVAVPSGVTEVEKRAVRDSAEPVSYTHLRAHETVLDLVCRLLLEKKKNIKYT